MKHLVLSILSVISLNTYARQYIQCADYATSNRVVLNLNEKKNTLFITDGLEQPDSLRVVKDLYLINVDEGSHKFESEKKETIEIVKVPSDVIGKNSNDFEINLEIRSKKNLYLIDHDLSCYSAIYN